MGRTNRFIEPEVIRLEISEGDWVEIKKELNVGEEKAMYAKCISDMSSVAGDPLKSSLDPAMLAFSLTEAYLVNWSFAREEDGKVTPVELSPSSIKALDQSSFDEIEAAIAKHLEGQEKKETSPKPKRRTKSR